MESNLIFETKLEILIYSINSWKNIWNRNKGVIGFYLFVLKTFREEYRDD